jgi:RHS repeat-associated protein
MIDLKEHNSYSDTIGCYSVPPPSYPLICHCPDRVHVRDHVEPVITTFTSFSNPTMGNITFYLYDHLGNTRVTYYQRSCGSTLTVENIIDYDPYGKVLREFSNNDDKERYVTTQHERDEETGYDYRGARFYDSDIARFLSVDPMAHHFPSWSPYSYSLCNPVRFLDPTGLESEEFNDGPKPSRAERKFDRKFNNFIRKSNSLANVPRHELYNQFKREKNFFGRSNAESQWFNRYENITKQSNATNWHSTLAVPSNLVAGGSGSGSGFLERTIDLGISTGQLQINYDMYSIADKIEIFNKETDALLFSSGWVRLDQGSGTIVDFDMENNTSIRILINDGKYTQGATNFDFNIILNPSEPQRSEIRKTEVKKRR